METLKILVVDDEPRMRKLVKDFLTVKGFQVVEAGDGEEAIDIFFEQKDIALILLCDDAENGWLGGVKDHQKVLPGSDSHADSQRGGAG